MSVMTILDFNPLDHAKSLLWPVTLIFDRYGGAYSGAKWTAWNCEAEQVPEAISSGDLECSEFWNNFEGLVGKGNTPDTAYKDLIEKCSPPKPKSNDS